jgi:hypothetical protein
MVVKLHSFFKSVKHGHDWSRTPYFNPKDKAPLSIGDCVIAGQEGILRERELSFKLAGRKTTDWQCRKSEIWLATSNGKQLVSYLVSNIKR